MNVIRAVVDLMIPKSCFGCGKASSEPICNDCNSALNYIDSPFCLKCSHPTLYEVDVCRDCRGKRLYFDESRSLLSYEGVAKEVFVQLKNSSSYALVDFFVKTALQRFSKDFFNVDSITYIPSTYYKTIARGRNPSQIIANCLAHNIKKPVVETLGFSKKVKDQASLSINERGKNLKDAFEIKKGTNLKGNILIIDDIYTTGTTVSQAAKVLCKEGLSARVFTLGRTLAC